uniref:BACK domain-containing protein n=1 Tax=Rhabditophanes sp. KR3021 TaxID=114890 RepID=A0AC35U0H6_9BILA
MFEYYSSGSDEWPEDEFPANLKVNTKDGFVMMPRSIIFLKNLTFFSKLVRANLYIAEVNCKKLTVSEVNSYIEFINSRVTFKVNCENVFLMIKINKVIEDECLEDLIDNYFYEAGLKPVGLLKYCREESLTDLYFRLKKIIQESFEEYVLSGYFDGDDWNTFIAICEDSFIPKTCQQIALKCFLGWVSHKFEERQQYCLRLIQKINYRFIPTKRIKEIFDEHKNVFEIDEVHIFVYETLYKRGWSILPNCKPTDIILTGNMWDNEDGEMSKIFNVSIFSRILNGFAVKFRYYEDADGYEIIEDHLLIFNDYDNYTGSQKFNLMTRQTENFTINNAKKYGKRSICQVNGQIISFVNKEIQRLDVSKMQWCTFSSFPFPNGFDECVVINHCVYIIGGEERSTHRYDIREGLWQQCASEQFECYCSALCSFDSKIMKVGGRMLNQHGDDYIDHQNCEMFDERANAWRVVSQLPVSLSKGKCCSIDNTVQLFGGYNNDVVSNNIHIFDIMSETWKLSDDVTYEGYQICSLNVI